MTQTDHPTPADLGLHGWAMKATDIDGGTHYVDEVLGYDVRPSDRAVIADVRFRTPGGLSMHLPIPLRRIEAVNIQ